MGSKQSKGIKWAFSWIVPGAVILLWLLSACQPALNETPTPRPTELPTDSALTPEGEGTLTPTGSLVSTPAATALPSATGAPTILPSATRSRVEPTLAPAAVVEARQVDLEWPGTMRLGDSDLVRLSLIPSEDRLMIEAEFQEHQVESAEVRVDRPPGFTLYATARLDAIGFEVSPAAEQRSQVPEGEALTWRWTITPLRAGQQRLAVGLILDWEPDEGVSGAVRESLIFSKGLDVRVLSFFGMTRSQAMMTGFFGLLFGGGLSLMALLARSGPIPPALKIAVPDTGVRVEPHPDLTLNKEEQSLFQGLFNHYGRLVLEREFLSGYSGARTFLGLPIRPDGRSDAYTIVKVGPSPAIRREFENYESFVKDTLPPLTARIQHPPVTVKGSRHAALRYTFLGEPGQAPVSLRQALLEGSPPKLLTQLFDTFGPGWWMQRRPYTFRAAEEYDRKLPTHFVIEPVDGRGSALDGRQPPSDAGLAIGDVVRLTHFRHVEPRADGKSLSLKGQEAPGQPSLRVRWLNVRPPAGASGRIVATRMSALRSEVAGFGRYGLPDPLVHLAGVLRETVSGTRSTIHGDLNLENILLGPGSLVWLIDFSETRDGHTLFDFAHLEAEIIAHILPQTIESPETFVDQLRAGNNSLLNSVKTIAHKCLFNPSDTREYDIALFMACVGALKFVNLEKRAKHFLYLTAANLVQSLTDP